MDRKRKKGAHITTLVKVCRLDFKYPTPGSGAWMPDSVTLVNSRCTHSAIRNTSGSYKFLNTTISLYPLFIGWRMHQAIDTGEEFQQLIVLVYRAC